eukprot:5217579-Pyramimonas_sp.AAC.1
MGIAFSVPRSNSTEGRAAGAPPLRSTAPRDLALCIAFSDQPARQGGIPIRDPIDDLASGGARHSGPATREEHSRDFVEGCCERRDHHTDATEANAQCADEGERVRG